MSDEKKNIIKAYAGIFVCSAIVGSATVATCYFMGAGFGLGMARGLAKAGIKALVL